MLAQNTLVLSFNNFKLTLIDTVSLLYSVRYTDKLDLIGCDAAEVGPATRYKSIRRSRNWSI